MALKCDFCDAELNSKTAYANHILLKHKEEFFNMFNDIQKYKEEKEKEKEMQQKEITSKQKVGENETLYIPLSICPHEYKLLSDNKVLALRVIGIKKGKYIEIKGIVGLE